MKRLCAFIGIAALTATLATAQEGVQITSDTFGGILARPIGPAVMSGRIAAIDAVAANPLTIYVGAASGGVWKSIDAGNTFKSVAEEWVTKITREGRAEITLGKVEWLLGIEQRVAIGDPGLRPREPRRCCRDEGMAELGEPRGSS